MMRIRDDIRFALFVIMKIPLILFFYNIDSHPFRWNGSDRQTLLKKTTLCIKYLKVSFL